MIFVIPMAGLGQRFRDAGYLAAKYQLLLHGRPVFDHAVRSFAAYFPTCPFLFVTARAAMEFVRDRCRVLGITSPRIVPLDHPTSGQAETVLRGIDTAGISATESITIFNIDTFRPGCLLPALSGDGYLEVFQGQGSHWSFVAPHPAKPFGVSATSEKLPISDLCCTGIYQFARASDFRWAYMNPSAPVSAAECKERYVAPLYNPLIARGLDIRYGVIPRRDVIFCGTPEEYVECSGSDDVAFRLGSRA